MSTNAIPLSAGRCLRSWVNASSPPAEAPTPTIGNAARRGGAERPAAVVDDEPVHCRASDSSISRFINARLPTASRHAR